jgi:hypothetical protein
VRDRRTLVLVQRDSDEDAWRTIVDNYGERVELDVEPVAEQPAPRVPAAEIWAVEAGPPEDKTAERDAELDVDNDDERFVPPTPPPLPRLPPDRALAWSGLFGSPTVLLVCLVLGVHLAPWLGYLLVAWFIGGFVYLVVQMPSGPSDPYDDGARL